MTRYRVTTGPAKSSTYLPIKKWLNTYCYHNGYPRFTEVTGTVVETVRPNKLWVWTFVFENKDDAMRFKLTWG